jgi:hypothetical protein
MSAMLAASWGITNLFVFCLYIFIYNLHWGCGGYFICSLLVNCFVSSLSFLLIDGLIEPSLWFLGLNQGRVLVVDFGCWTDCMYEV